MKTLFLYGALLLTLGYISAHSRSAHAGDALDSILKCEGVTDKQGHPSFTVYIRSEGKTRDAYVDIFQLSDKAWMKLPSGAVEVTNSWMDLNQAKILMMRTKKNEVDPVLWIHVEQAPKVNPGSADTVIYKGEIEFKKLAKDLFGFEAKDKNVICDCGSVAKNSTGELQYETWTALADGCTPNTPNGK